MKNGNEGNDGRRVVAVVVRTRAHAGVAGRTKIGGGRKGDDRPLLNCSCMETPTRHTPRMEISFLLFLPAES